jgi:hypothetical protein
MSLLFLPRDGDSAGAYSRSLWLWFGADEVAPMNQTRLDTSSRDLHEGHRHVADGMQLFILGIQDETQSMQSSHAN